MKTTTYRICRNPSHFTGKPLGVIEVRRKEAADGSFIIVYLSNEESDFQLELTWLKDKEGPYDLGECEFHLAFEADDYETAYARHKAMGCICYETPRWAFTLWKTRMVIGWK